MPHLSPHNSIANSGGRTYTPLWAAAAILVVALASTSGCRHSCCCFYTPPPVQDADCIVVQEPWQYGYQPTVWCPWTPGCFHGAYSESPAPLTPAAPNAESEPKVAPPLPPQPADEATKAPPAEISPAPQIQQMNFSTEADRSANHSKVVLDLDANSKTRGDRKSRAASRVSVNHDGSMKRSGVEIELIPPNDGDSKVQREWWNNRLPASSGPTASTEWRNSTH